MSQFKVIITTPGTGLELASEALVQAGIQLHEPGWGQSPGEAPAMVGPHIVAEVYARPRSWK